MSEDNVLYSRSGRANPLGKRVNEVKVMLDDETLNSLMRYSSMVDLTKSECVSVILQNYLIGHATMLKERAMIGMPRSV